MHLTAIAVLTLFSSTTILARSIRNDNATTYSHHDFTVAEGGTYQLHGTPHSPNSLTIWTTHSADGDPAQRFAVHDAGETTFSGMCQPRNGNASCTFDPWTGTLTLLNVSVQERMARHHVYSFNGDFNMQIGMEYLARDTPVMFVTPPDTVTAGDVVSVQCGSTRFSYGTADISWYVDLVKVEDGETTQIPSGNVDTVIGTADVVIEEEYDGGNFTCGINSLDSAGTNWRVHSIPQQLRVRPGQSTTPGSKIPSESQHFRGGNGKDVSISELEQVEEPNIREEPIRRSSIAAQTVFAMEMDVDYQLGGFPRQENAANASWYKDGQSWPQHVIAVSSDKQEVVYSGACLASDNEPECGYIERTGTLIIKNVSLSSAGMYMYRYDTNFWSSFTYNLVVSVLQKPTMTIKPPDVINDGESVPVLCSVDRLYPNEVYVSWFIDSVNVTSGSTSIEVNGDTYRALNVAVVTMDKEDNGRNLLCVAVAAQYRGLQRQSDPFVLNIQ